MKGALWAGEGSFCCLKPINFAALSHAPCCMGLGKELFSTSEFPLILGLFYTSERNEKKEHFQYRKVNSMHSFSCNDRWRVAGRESKWGGIAPEGPSEDIVFPRIFFYLVGTPGIPRSGGTGVQMALHIPGHLKSVTQWVCTYLVLTKAKIQMLFKVSPI